jgi:hypothetical protein
MNCEIAVGLLVDSLMDALDEERQARLTMHLGSCESCAAEAKELRLIWKGLGELPVPKASPRVSTEFSRRFYPARGGRSFSPVLRAAAMGALLLIGGTAGFLLRASNPQSVAPSTEGSTYLLLVRGQVPNVMDATDVVEEYAAWAESLERDGRLVEGRKLMDEPGRWVSRPEAREIRKRSDVSGYFLIGASSYEDVIQLAQSSPHVQYGGTFEIREVDPGARSRAVPK